MCFQKSSKFKKIWSHHHSYLFIEFVTIQNEDNAYRHDKQVVCDKENGTGHSSHLKQLTPYNINTVYNILVIITFTVSWLWYSHHHCPYF